MKYHTHMTSTASMLGAAPLIQQLSFLQLWHGASCTAIMQLARAYSQLPIPLVDVTGSFQLQIISEPWSATASESRKPTLVWSCHFPLQH